MSTNSGFQIGVLAGGYARNPFAGYVTEILDTQGFSYEVTEDPCGGYDVIVVPELDMPQDLVERLWEAANRGVGVVAMRPNYALLPLFGLTSDSQPCPVIIDGHYSDSMKAGIVYCFPSMVAINIGVVFF